MLQTPQVNTNSSRDSPSEDQLAEAEHLKTDGKTIHHTFTNSVCFLSSYGLLTQSVACMYLQATIR